MRLMGEHDIGPKAAMCMLGHGQVRLDGRVLGVNEVRLPKDAVYGKLLQIPGRSFRLIGSALAPVHPLPPPKPSYADEHGGILTQVEVDEQLSLL